MANRSLIFAFGLVIAAALVPSQMGLGAQAPPPSFGPSLADTLFLAPPRVAALEFTAAPAWLRSPGPQLKERRRAPPELIGGLIGMSIGFAAGSAYGVYYDIRHCTWACGLGPVAFGIYGAGYGVMIGAAAGLVSRLF